MELNPGISRYNTDTLDTVTLHSVEFALFSKSVRDMKMSGKHVVWIQ